MGDIKILVRSFADGYFDIGPQILVIFHQWRRGIKAIALQIMEDYQTSDLQGDDIYLGFIDEK